MSHVCYETTASQQFAEMRCYARAVPISSWRTFQQLALVAPPDTDNEADEDDEDLSEDDGSSDKIDSTLVLEEEPPPVASCPLFTEATQATSRGNTLSRVAGSRLPLSLTPISSHFKQRIH
jgi:hypothetical protein